MYSKLIMRDVALSISLCFYLTIKYKFGIILLINYRGGTTVAEENIKLITQNKKARHDYFILETIEAGIELFGTEVKSVRLGKVNLTDAYASINNGEVFIKGMNISPYEQGNIFNKDPLRERKLLLHKNQIRKLIGQLQQQGYSLIPLSVYLKGSLVKVSVALAKGKKLYDKRDDIAKRDSQRHIDRVMKDRRNAY
jgi:SsrA-binding protein